MPLAQATTELGPFLQFGAAGLIGLMWLYWMKQSQKRNEQLDEAHRRIIADNMTVAQLVEVVKQNSETMSKNAAIVDHFCRMMEQKNKE